MAGTGTYPCFLDGERHSRCSDFVLLCPGHRSGGTSSRRYRHDAHPGQCDTELRQLDRSGEPGLRVALELWLPRRGPRPRQEPRPSLVEAPRCAVVSPRVRFSALDRRRRRVLRPFAPDRKRHGGGQAPLGPDVGTGHLAGLPVAPQERADRHRRRSVQEHPLDQAIPPGAVFFAKLLGALELDRAILLHRGVPPGRHGHASADGDIAHPRH
mmetsp:Transcript_65751/g.183130  ORF Transcript_65751/g.183130 Transcript_65751/m.183130 type:complete len:212 (+) Transcript_65751:86-721(+)